MLDCDIAAIKSWVEDSDTVSCSLSPAIPVQLTEFHEGPSRRPLEDVMSRCDPNGNQKCRNDDVRLPEGKWLRAGPEPFQLSAFSHRNVQLSIVLPCYEVVMVAT